MQKIINGLGKNDKNVFNIPSLYSSNIRCNTIRTDSLTINGTDLNSILTTASITSGSINNTPIGNRVPSSGVFTSTTITDTTDATSSISGGAFTTLGGAAVAKKMFVGSSLSVLSEYILFPKLTTTERNALTPENGMVLYNTTTSKLQCYSSGVWNDLF